MKDLLKNGLLIVFAVGIVYLIFLRECKQPVETIIQTDTIVGPSLVLYDTIYIIKEKPVYVTKYLKADTVFITKNTEMRRYIDSIWNDSIHFRQTFTVAGHMVSLEQYYEPLHYFRDRVTEKPIYIKSYEPKNEFYVSGILSGNLNTFSPGVSFDYINKKRNLYGVQVQYLDGNFIYGVRIGAKLKF